MSVVWIESNCFFRDFRFPRKISIFQIGNIKFWIIECTAADTRTLTTFIAKILKIYQKINIYRYFRDIRCAQYRYTHRYGLWWSDMANKSMRCADLGCKVFFLLISGVPEQKENVRYLNYYHFASSTFQAKRFQRLINTRLSQFRGTILSRTRTIGNDSYP